MNKKRIAVYAALIFVFALACVFQMAPRMIARAAEIEPAAIGTASLSDDGDTVFIRTAKFTVGEKDLYVAGFTVANAAEGADPADGVDLDTLTPITVANPITGTLDKDIYVCESEMADIYVGNLELATGRRIYTDGSSLNFLGGDVEADSIETTGTINLASANVTVNSDLTGFKAIYLQVSEDTGNDEIAFFGTPSSLTVNGNVANTGDEYNAAIDVINGGKLKVTGNISTAKNINMTNNCSLEVGGDLTVGSGCNLSVYKDSTAVIGGKVKTGYFVHVGENSTLSADSVDCIYLAGINGSIFTVANDVVATGGIDLGKCGGECTIGGNATCGTLNANTFGKPFSVGGDLKSSSVFVKECEFTVGGGINNSGSFRFDNADVEIGGAVHSGSYFDAYMCDITVHGPVTVDNSICPISATTLTIEGDANLTILNPINSSNITIEGNLNSKDGGYLNVNNSVLSVTGNVTCPGFDLTGNNAKTDIGGKLYAPNRVGVEGTAASLTVGGDVTTSGSFHVWGKEVDIGGSVIGATSMTVDQTTELNIDGDISISGMFSSNPGGKINIGGDFTYSYNYGRIGGDFTVGGNFTNTAVKEYMSNGLYVDGKLNVAGDVLMNDLLLNYKNYEDNINVEGNIQAHRVADIIADEEGTYVVDGVTQTSSDFYTTWDENMNEKRYISHTVPFNQRIISVEIDGDLSAVEITDLSSKTFAKAEGQAYNLTLETNGGVYVNEYIPDSVYLPGKEAALPTMHDVRIIGYMLEGWYDNAELEGTALTAIPADKTGDLTFYAKWVECDHSGSTVTATCAHPTYCSVCTLELPMPPHTWNEPEWDWSDVEHPAYSTTCSVCDTGTASGEADSVTADAHKVTLDADAYTDYTAEVTIDGQAFSGTYRVTEEGSMLALRKATFEEYKSEKSEEAGKEALEGDSSQCKQLIADAVAAIEALKYDEAKSLEENKQAADAIVSKLEEDLAEHRKEYTATFTADGKTLGTAKFTIDTESIKDKEPAIPEKEGYNGAWAAYTLGKEDITVEAVYTAVEYKAVFTDDTGKTVAEVPYTTETESITAPAVPQKTGYIGEWEEYTLKLGGITVKAVYTEVPTEGFEEGAETDSEYKENKTYTVDTSKLPEGSEVHWYVNGEEVAVGESYTMENPTDGYTIQMKITDKDGNVICESEEQTVNVKKGFFDRLRAFFIALFERISEFFAGLFD